MAKFADNNTIAAGTDITLFYTNKDFHPQMSFASNDTKYETACKQVQTPKAEDITDTLENILNIMKKNAEKLQAIIKHHVDKHWKEITYKVRD